MQETIFKKEILTNAQHIQQLLHWDELAYNQYIYECGMQYLHEYIVSEPLAIAALERSRIFWAWWRNHWSIRDKQFLAKVNIHAPADGILKFYEHFNNPRKLARSVWPNAVVLHDSYARMIGEFNDELKSTN